MTRFKGDFLAGVSDQHHEKIVSQWDSNSSNATSNKLGRRFTSVNKAMKKIWTIRNKIFKKHRNLLGWITALLLFYYNSDWSSPQHVCCYPSCSTWYIMGFWQGLACWSSSHFVISIQVFRRISSFHCNRLLWFRIEILRNRFLIMLRFLKALFLVLHFCCYILMIFLTILISVTLYLLWWYYSLLELCPGFWFMATAWVVFWTWLWHKTHSGVK